MIQEGLYGISIVKRSNPNSSHKWSKWYSGGTLWWQIRRDIGDNILCVEVNVEQHEIRPVSQRHLASLRLRAAREALKQNLAKAG